MHATSRVVASMVVLALAAVPVSAEVTADQVDAAVARGLAYLWSRQAPDGSFGPYRFADLTFVGGNDVTAMTVMAYAGEPPEKPQMKNGLKALCELQLDNTYTLSFRLLALAELYRRSPDAKAKEGLRSFMKQDAEKLAGFQLDNGGWDYFKRSTPAAGRDWDFSNTQIAVLGLQQAALCGVEVKPDVFLKALQLYLDKQLPDGGWNYGRPGNERGDNTPSFGSMTAAAVASLFIIRDLLDPGQGCPCRGDRSASARNTKVQAAIDRGVKWLGDKFSPVNPVLKSWPNYWLYAVERVGIATGFKYLGTHAWYAEGAEAIMAAQRPNGAWGGDFGFVPETSLALLFLIKGRGPILMNKLQYDGDWDLHPRDAENLADYVGRTKEQRFNWQVVHLGVPVEELHDAPLLYISAEAAIPWKDAEKKKLREFTDSGGTILFEASCGNRVADAWWRKTCSEIWPEWELKALDNDHPLWSADVKLTGRRPVLHGVSDGLRTIIFYSPRDISCGWNTQAMARSKIDFDLGSNLYAYATDHGRLRARLAQREIGVGKKYAGQKPSGSGSVTVVRVKHGGEWYAGKNYHPWEMLAADLKATAAVDLKELDPVAPGDAIPAGTNLLYLSGRSGCELGDAGARWLKSYAAGGGFLFAEAVLGDTRFDAAFRSAMAIASLTLKPLPPDSPIITGQFGGARGYDASKVGYTHSLQTERVGQPGPSFEGLYLGNKLVGVYSPFDVMYAQTGGQAYGSRGYAADDARALAVNIALAASAAVPAGAAVVPSGAAAP